MNNDGNRMYDSNEDINNDLKKDKESNETIKSRKDNESTKSRKDEEQLIYFNGEIKILPRASGKTTKIAERAKELLKIDNTKIIILFSGAHNKKYIYHLISEMNDKIISEINDKIIFINTKEVRWFNKLCGYLDELVEKYFVKILVDVDQEEVLIDLFNHKSLIYIDLCCIPLEMLVDNDMKEEIFKQRIKEKHSENKM
ncbi:MAG: hypothetical protein IJ094_12855 [Bacilli bacterium]|nr:hypothetical protein [Bacilli bacterium]